MYDDFLAQRRRDDVVAGAEGRKDALVNQGPQGLEQELLPDQGNTAADDNASRAEQGDDVAEGVSQVSDRRIQDGFRNCISLACRCSHVFRSQRALSMLRLLV
jgi:hypothetical protein